jgi:hypothetical protein
MQRHRDDNPCEVMRMKKLGYVLVYLTLVLSGTAVAGGGGRGSGDGTDSLPPAAIAALR